MGEWGYEADYDYFPEPEPQTHFYFVSLCSRQITNLITRKCLTLHGNGEKLYKRYVTANLCLILIS